MAELSWNPDHNRGLTLEDVQKHFGRHYFWLTSQPDPVQTAKGRAGGAWLANDREGFAYYTRAAELLAG
jgi:hypothetical protein